MRENVMGNEEGEYVRVRVRLSKQVSEAVEEKARATGIPYSAMLTRIINQQMRANSPYDKKSNK